VRPDQTNGSIYELIGRLVVGFVRWRYRRQLRIAAASGVALASLAAVGIYFAARDDEEA
jgi:hypothetical protein